MYISLDWVNDFVKLPAINPDELANSFTMTTAEVEEVKTTFQHLKEIKVAQIESIRKHPEADKLNLVTINFGSKESKEVVCGAPNVAVGIKIPYAPLGVTLPNGLTLEPKKIRGVLSEGMLCSQVELGIGEASSGIMELPDEAKIGQPMLEFLELKADTILDVDNKSLTHRPDLWGHLGIAREFSAAYDLDLINPYGKSWEASLEKKFTKDDSPIKPKVHPDTSCLGYFGLSVKNVDVGSSPVWMVNRLEACGLRSINNIVDISNYVMLELGNPLHIFDRNSIENNTIEVKKLTEPTKFTTLDEVERDLTADDSVICDSNKVLVLAGIMGGGNSGVSESTKEIFIECANWKAPDIRKTSTRLGLRTDSSQRFEKSLDTHQCYRTVLRTLELILELCPKAQVVGKVEYDGEKLSKFKPLMIKTSPKLICTRLGHDVPTDKIETIFSRLEFDIKKVGEVFEVTLPSFRTTKDIEYEACLIEEIGRVIGYDNIIPVSPQTDIVATRFEPAKSLYRKVQDFMVMQGNSLEVMTYPLIGKKLLEKASWPTFNEELKLVNALSIDADRMRPSLIPHALNTVAVNAKQFTSFNFFEMGRSYLPNPKTFSSERFQVIIGKFNKKETPFISLIDDVEKLLRSLDIPFDLVADSGKHKNEIVDRDWVGAHPHEYVNIRIMGKFQGVITSVHPLILKSFKAKGFFSLAVIDFTDFHTRPIKTKAKYTPISKFPSASFDCTVLVAKNSPSGSVLLPLKKLRIKELTEYKIVDVFPLNEEHNAVTVTVIFEDPSKTLDSALIKASEQAVMDCLDKAGFPLKQ